MHTRKPSGARRISSTSVLGQENLGHGCQSSRQSCPLQCDHTVTFHTKGMANVTLALGAPLSLTVTNRFCPLSRAKCCSRDAHGLSWQPERPHALHMKDSSSASLQPLFRRDYTTFYVGKFYWETLQVWQVVCPSQLQSTESLLQTHPTALAGSSSCTLGPVLYFQTTLQCWCEACTEQQTPECLMSPARTK